MRCNDSRNCQADEPSETLLNDFSRSRLLIAIRTEISDNVEMAPSEVEVEPTVLVNESAYARNEEFFLFATIMDATMIDKKLGDKPMYFEISIGNAGNALDGHNESSKVSSVHRPINFSISRYSAPRRG